MSIDAKKIVVSLLAIVFLASLLIVAWVEGGKQRFAPAPEMLLSEESTACYNCHKEKTPAIVNQWVGSRHGEVGISCYECHKADEKDPDAWKHNGRIIATIVTPKDCGRCHATIADEFSKSSHSRAADVEGSLDAVLAAKLQGPETAAVGCQKCHGAKIEFQVDDKGKTIKDSEGKPMIVEGLWPNTGMGRINPDGSRGACTACHSRHRFDIAMARRPEACGKCHTGPDHSQEGIYQESKHGVAFNNALSQGLMHLEQKKWVVGKDYSAAPTCATCHMSASPDQPMTHNTAARIAWNCRPPVSTHPEDYEINRINMQSICLNCHAPTWVDGHFKQYDNAVEMWNKRFGEPGTKIMDKLAAAGLITQQPFDDPLEWVWYTIWHREGRQARMGAAMMGPAFAQMEGFADVAKSFFGEFLPGARALAKSNAAVNKDIDDILKEAGVVLPVLTTVDDRAKVEKFYQDKYKQNVR